ncbi:MAG: InlB B-repeat-containing protein, partial [Aristaeellaceae bacterium]
DAFDTVFPDKITTGENCQVLLYDRSNLTLSVWTNADNYTNDPQTATYLYGDWIYNDDTDLLKTLEKNMVKTGYVFAGWYTDSEFTPGTEYKPDENTRITANLNLYAKWEPDQFTAKYYLYLDDAEPYATQGFAEGGKIEDKFVPAAVQDQFLGWYWYQNGTLVPFDFTSTVGAAHVDNNGVLKLYARWEGATGKVSYLPGKGGDNSTQEVFDSRDFEINEAAVQLPVYTKVWTDGSVPSDKDLTFVGWKAPNGKIYQPGRYVLVTRQLMQFEAQWSKDAVQLIYDANGGTGLNVTETWERSSEVDIWDNMDNTTPHFTRDGYKLLGWDEDMNATVPTYKLGEGTITLTADTTTLYAIWKKSTTSASIQKNVSGNFGDLQRDFTFKVKVVDENGASVVVDGMPYEDGYYTFTLKHGEKQPLNNLPIGDMLYFHEEGADNYTQTVNQGDASITTKVDGDYVVTISDGMAPIMFNNSFDVTPDTGVVLDSLPYIVILVIVLVGVVLMVRRRRREDD